jgi:hypothetical protein
MHPPTLCYGPTVPHCYAVGAAYPFGVPVMLVRVPFFRRIMRNRLSLGFLFVAVILVCALVYWGAWIRRPDLFVNPARGEPVPLREP